MFERAAFEFWDGQNLENEVLPKLAFRGELYTYRHQGFWKSMDTSKDQQEMEMTYNGGNPPWSQFDKLNALSAGGIA